MNILELNDLTFTDLPLMTNLYEISPYENQGLIDQSVLIIFSDYEVIVIYYHNHNIYVVIIIYDDHIIFLKQLRG